MPIFKVSISVNIAETKIFLVNFSEARAWIAILKKHFMLTEKKEWLPVTRKIGNHE